MKKTRKVALDHKNFQNYVTIIYIALLGVGILFDTIYFSFFEVNILRYSNVMDIVLTPLDFLIEIIAHFRTVTLLKVILIGLILILPIFLMVLYFKHANKKYWNNRHKIKVNSENFEKNLKNDKQRRVLLKSTLLGFFCGLIMPILFLQLTFPAKTTVSQMKVGDLRPNHKIIFMDNSEKNVHLIRERSQYVFYVVEKDTQITIAPIVGTIKEIKKIAATEIDKEDKSVLKQDTSSMDIN